MAIAASAIAMLSSCNNIVAQNDNKSKKVEHKNVIELTSDTFRTKVYDIEDPSMTYLGSKPAIIDFTAAWCRPCRSIAPILEEIAAEYKDKIVVYKVDVDKCRDIVNAFGITSIPAILYIPLEGEPSMTFGARNKAKFQEEINKILLR